MTSSLRCRLSWRHFHVLLMKLFRLRFRLFGLENLSRFLRWLRQILFHDFRLAWQRCCLLFQPVAASIFQNPAPCRTSNP